MLGPRHEIARLASDFYRNQFHKTLRWLFYTLVIIFFLIAGIIYEVLARKSPQYYANTTEGKIMLMPRQQ